MKIDVITTCDTSPGWAPVMHLGKLAAQLFGGDFENVLSRGPSRWRKALALRPRWRNRGSDGLLIVLKYAHEMSAVRQLAQFRQAYRFVAVWIIDSPLTEMMPPRGSFSDIDFLGVMRPNDMEAFRRIAGDRVVWLGWGSDVLGLGSGSPLRPTDLLRVGRQPDAWDNDAQTAHHAAERGLVFEGRPTFSPDPDINQRMLVDCLAQTKYVVAHSNLVSQSAYTHKSQEYITARWTDALACGASVAGYQPLTDHSMKELLWPDATLHFDRVDLAHNLEALAEAVHAWTPKRAQDNHHQALARLDWRWRLKIIADHAGLRSNKLERDLDHINTCIGQ